MTFVIPRSRSTIAGVKPQGDVSANLSHPALVDINAGDLFPHNHKTETGIARGVSSVFTGLTTDVEHFDIGTALYMPISSRYAGSTANIDMGGWRGLTVLAVVNTSVPSTTVEHSQLRWASTYSQGVSLSVLYNTASTFALRALISTSGSSIWTAAHDYVLPASYVDEDIVLAMTYDGANRHMYASIIGEELTLLRSDSCTGAINSQSGAGCIMQGGFHSASHGQGRQYLTLIKDSSTSIDALSEISTDIGSLFEPRKTYFLFPESASGAYTLVCDSGTYTATGTAADLIKDSSITAESGSYVYSGTALDLINGVALAAESGSYIYNGSIIDLVGSGSLVMGSGAYTYTGTDATLAYNAIMDAESGSYAYTGTSVNIITGSSIQLDSGSYVVTGADIAFNVTSVISMESGEYNYIGNSVSLVYSGAGTWIIQPDSTASWAAQLDSTTTWTIQ